MKKIVSIIMMLAMVLTMTACSEEMTLEEMAELKPDGILAGVLEEQETQQTETDDYIADDDIVVTTTYFDGILDEYDQNWIAFKEKYVGETLCLENAVVKAIREDEIAINSSDGDIIYYENPDMDTIMSLIEDHMYNSITGTIVDVTEYYIYLTDCTFE